MYQERIQQNQKFLLRLLNLHIGHYYPLRKWLGIDYCGVIDEVSHLSYAFDSKLIRKGGHLYKQQTRVYQQPDLGYKLNLILDCIPEAIIPKYGQPSWGLIGMRLARCSESVFQPPSKDTYVSSSYSDSNYGSETFIRVVDFYNDVHRGILEFDISDIPTMATFSQGDLLLYYYLYYLSDPTGKSIWAYKLTRTDWVELEATWNIYKTGSYWTTAGGDYVTSNPAGGNTTFPSSYGWMTWDIQAIVENAYDTSNNVEILVRFNNENLSGPDSHCYFYSKEYTGDTSLRPKLTVTYVTLLQDFSQIALSSFLIPYEEQLDSSSFSLSANLEPNRWKKDTTHSQIWIKEETHNEIYKS